MKITKILLTVLTCTLAVSCGDQLADINKDPNQSNSGGTGIEVFVSATTYYAVALEAYFHEEDALMAQYWAGGPGVALFDHERYFFEPADFNNEWSFSYNQALSDYSYVKANGNAALSAMSEVMSCLIYQNLVDHYGDVPYSEALKGNPADGGITTPVYDDAASIYADLIVRLDAAIGVLSNETGLLTAADLTVGEEDLLYEGDLDSWIAFANSLKLRILMRQSQVDASVGTAVADLIANGTFINDQASMARIPFQGEEGLNQNPMYIRRESGVGQFYCASKTSTDVMEDFVDPRGLVIYDPAGGPGTLVGLKQGNVNDEPGNKPDDYSYPSAVAYGEENEVILMSPWEVYFLRAEAAVRFGTTDDETAMYDEAVTEHFSYIGAGSAAGFLSTSGFYDVAASEDDKLDLIGIQKWVSMNGLQESEGWIEARRFDRPSSRLFTEGIFVTPTNSVLADGVFPSIRLYPQSELSFNPNAPAGRSIDDKVFWDN